MKNFSPYEETEDQLKAIEATKADMESDRIMDRLICGDVGYGKTEIAIRAAFKAVMDGRQGCLFSADNDSRGTALQYFFTAHERLRN